MRRCCVHRSAVTRGSRCPAQLNIYGLVGLCKNRIGVIHSEFISTILEIIPLSWWFQNNVFCAASFV